MNQRSLKELFCRGARQLALSLALAMFAVGFVASPDANAAIKQESVSSGPVTATMSFEDSDLSQVRTSVARFGTTVFDQVPLPICEFCLVRPGGFDLRPSVHVLQLDASPEPEVVFDLFTGGAHCCSYVNVLRFTGATYAGPTHRFDDPGYSFADLDGNGISEFQSLDGRFAYKFASFAGSAYPPQIWSFTSGAMVDVTRQYPSVVERSLDRHRRAYKHRRGEQGVRALITALAAEWCLLSRCQRGLGIVDRAARAGYLDLTEVGKRTNGAKFVRTLRKFLRRTDYL